MTLPRHGKVPTIMLSPGRPAMRLQTSCPGLAGDLETTTSPFLTFLVELSLSTITTSPTVLNVGSIEGPTHLNSITAFIK